VARVGVGAVRRGPRARFQVCLRAGHPCRVFQVPLSPHQLPGPRPRPRPGKTPFFAPFTDRDQRDAAAAGLAVLVLRHRRDPLTQPKHRPRESTMLENGEGREDHIHVIRKRVYLLLPPRCIVSFVCFLIKVRLMRLSDFAENQLFVF